MIKSKINYFGRQTIYNHNELQIQRLKQTVRAKTVIPWYLVDPDSTKKKVWDGLMIVILIYIATIAPYRVAFGEEATELWLIIFDYTVDSLFVIDIVLNFLTPFERDTGSQEVRLKYIAKRYLLSGFAVDFMASFPTQVLQPGGEEAE